MANSPRRVCWDARVWIALIQDERIIEDGLERSTRCKTVLEEAKKGKIEVVISALCLAEVCKNKGVADTDPQKIAAFFEHEYILVVSLDTTIGNRARELMMSGIPGLRPQDACHIATALIAPDVTEFHTFDTDLLKLSGQLAKSDGSKLKVCYPDVGPPMGPLLAEGRTP